MSKKMILVNAIMLVLSGIIVADDLFPPTWRGDAKTVNAEWDSWDSGGIFCDSDQWSSGTGQLSTAEPPFAFLDPAPFIPLPGLDSP